MPVRLTFRLTVFGRAWDMPGLSRATRISSFYGCGEAGFASYCTPAMSDLGNPMTNARVCGYGYAITINWRNA
jgi:hypothetical protein